MIPTIREVRWSFVIVAACGIALTATICWGIAHKINQSDVIVRIAANSADQVERLSAQLDQQAAAARAQARAAQQQREQLRQQNRLTRAQLQALLAYLRAQSIRVPPTVLPPVPRETRPRHSLPKAPAASGTPPPKPRPKPSSTTASPAPIPTPSPTPASPSPVCALLPILCP